MLATRNAINPAAKVLGTHCPPGSLAMLATPCSAVPVRWQDWPVWQECSIAQLNLWNCHIAAGWECRASLSLSGWGPGDRLDLRFWAHNASHITPCLGHFWHRLGEDPVLLPLFGDLTYSSSLPTSCRDGGKGCQGYCNSLLFYWTGWKVCSKMQ